MELLRKNLFQINFVFMKYLLLVAFFFSGYSSIHAQDNELPAKKEQRIQALYVAYITEQLNLTESEAQKFWPVQNQYDHEIKSVNPNLPELDRQQAILDIKKKYQNQFIKIIGNSRTDDFFKKDVEFRKKLVEQLRKIRQQNHNQRRLNNN